MVKDSRIDDDIKRVVGYTGAHHITDAIGFSFLVRVRKLNKIRGNVDAEQL
jgi:hypothetical protein